MNKLPNFMKFGGSGKRLCDVKNAYFNGNFHKIGKPLVANTKRDRLKFPTAYETSP